MNLAGETAKSVCLGSAPLWVLGQRSPAHSTLFAFLVGLVGRVTITNCAYFAKQVQYVTRLLPSGGRGRRLESSHSDHYYQ